MIAVKAGAERLGSLRTMAPNECAPTMQPKPNIQTSRHLDALSPSEASALLAHARTLQRAAESGQARPLLRGKNLGLVCEDVDGPEAILFHQAAAELGANIARIKPSLTELGSSPQMRHTSRMLGRLYDAVVCEGVAPGIVQQLRRDAGVPVLDSVASPDHPIAELAIQLPGESPEDKHRLMLQALLLSTLG